MWISLNVKKYPPLSEVKEKYSEKQARENIGRSLAKNQTME